MASHHSGPAVWTIADFLVTVLAGFAGAIVVALFLAGSASSTFLVASLFGQYTGHLLGLAFVIRRRSSSFAALGLDVRPSDGLYVLGGIALQVGLALVSAPIASRLGSSGSTQTLSTAVSTLTGSFAVIGMVVAATIVAPVTEELMFRGLLPKALRRRTGPRAAYVWAALVFALFHLSGVTPGTHFLADATILMLQLFVVGLVLGWQAQKRRRLGVSIFIHSGFNLLAILALLIAPSLIP